MQESQASWQTSATLRRIRSLLLANLVEEKAAHPSARSQSQLQSQSAARAASQHTREHRTNAGCTDTARWWPRSQRCGERLVAEEAQGRRQKRSTPAATLPRGGDGLGGVHQSGEVVHQLARDVTDGELVRPDLGDG